MDAILKTLLTEERFGLSDAHNVLLTGCSSGGLAAYLHADRVRDTIAASAPGLAKFRVAPDSGFFLFHESIAGVPVYPDQIKNVVEMSNATSGLNPQCIASMSDADRCVALRCVALRCRGLVSCAVHSTPTNVPYQQESLSRGTF